MIPKGICSIKNKEAYLWCNQIECRESERCTILNFCNFCRIKLHTWHTFIAIIAYWQILVHTYMFNCFSCLLRHFNPKANDRWVEAHKEIDIPSGIQYTYSILVKNTTSWISDEKHLKFGKQYKIWFHLTLKQTSHEMFFYRHVLHIRRSVDW